MYIDAEEAEFIIRSRLEREQRKGDLGPLNPDKLALELVRELENARSVRGPYAGAQSGPRRFYHRLRFWALILASFVAWLFGAFSFLSDPAVSEKLLNLLSVVRPAHGAGFGAISPDLRGWLQLAVFLVLTTVYFVALVQMVFGQRQRPHVTDLVKTLTGFFVGLATNSLS